MSIEIERILQNEIFRQIFAHCDVRVDRINESGRKKKFFVEKKGFQHEHETKLESKTLKSTFSSVPLCAHLSFHWSDYL